MSSAEASMHCRCHAGGEGFMHLDDCEVKALVRFRCRVQGSGGRHQIAAIAISEVANCLKFVCSVVRFGTRQACFLRSRVWSWRCPFMVPLGRVAAAAGLTDVSLHQHRHPPFTTGGKYPRGPLATDLHTHLHFTVTVDCDCSSTCAA